MRILITGSTGMIGKRLVEKLKKKHTITEANRRKGINITHKKDCGKIMKNVEVVIHAAAELDETKTEEEIWKTNVEGTVNLLETAEENNIHQFIFLSTVGVYGEQTKKMDENTIGEPITAYERTKTEAEKRVWNYQEVFPVTIIRPALVIGPNPYWSKIFKTIKKGFPLIGEGKNPWQMIEVDDLVAFIEHALGNEEMYNEIYICAEKEVHSLREVVDMIADILHVKKTGTIPKSAGMAISHLFGIYGKIMGKKPLLIPAHVKRLFKHREYDITKALRTGWKPRYSTKEALEKTYRELNELKTFS